MTPQYTVYKSALCDFSLFTCLLLLILGIIPGVIYIVYKVLYAKNYCVEFYEDKYIVRSGIISKKETETVFKGVYSVSMEQNLSGRMFRYGSVYADVVGKHDLALIGISDPQECKEYLQTRKVDSADINASVLN